MATNGKHIRQKTKSVSALRNSKGDVECCRTAFRFRITNIVKKLARVPKNDKMIEPKNAMVEAISSIITSVLFEEISVRFETSVGFEDEKLPSNDILRFILTCSYLQSHPCRLIVSFSLQCYLYFFKFPRTREFLRTLREIYLCTGAMMNQGQA